MDNHIIENMQPFVRMVKIRKHKSLSGDFTDFDHVLVYIAEGSAVYSINGYSYTLHSGDILLMPPYLRHSVFNMNNENVVQYIIHFDFYIDPVRCRLSHQSADDFTTPPVLPDHEKILNGKVYTYHLSEKRRFEYENLFLQAYREFSDKKEGYSVYLKSLLTQMLILALRSMHGKPSSSIEQGKKNSKSLKLVQAAQEYIWLNYSEKLDNETVAAVLSVTPNYLTKIFQKYSGMPLHKYIRSYRLEVARMMLTNDKYNITEIAQKCGFSSIHLFSKLFKKEYGVSPSEYADLPAKENDGTENKRGYRPEKLTYYN